MEIKKILFTHQIMIYLIPVSLVLSIFVADLMVVSLSLFFILYSFLINNLKIFKNKYFVFFSIFWIYLIINSFLSFDLTNIFSRSLPYIRYGILFLALSFFLINKISKKFT